jgi:hypothetical protein
MTSPRPTRRSSRLRILEGENYTVENVQNQPTTEASQEGQSPLRLPSPRRARYTNDTSLLVEEEASFWGLPKEIKLVIGQYVSHV